MHWLFLSAILDFGFVQFFKLGERRGCYAPVVVVANYFTVAVTIGAYLLVTDNWTFAEGTVETGLITGVLFISSMLLLNHALTIAPVGSVLSAFRIAIIIPVFFGVYLWDEPLALIQAVGLLLALFALVLMTPGAQTDAPGAQTDAPGAQTDAPGAQTDAARAQTDARFTGIRAFGLLAIVCLWQGLSHTSLRSVHYKGLDESFLHVLMLTGLTAGLIGTAFILLKKRRPRLPEVKLGVFIGAYNAVALCVIMIGLSKLPGTLFFPVLGCSVVLFDNLFAHFYWREPLNRPAIAGVGIAILSLALVV